MDAEAGARLEGFVRQRWRKKGGISALAGRIGSSRETIYAWFRGDVEPRLDSLTALAEALEVRRSYVLAVMDGDTPAVTLDDATQAAMLGFVEEWAARRGLLGPRQEPDASSGEG